MRRILVLLVALSLPLFSVNAFAGGGPQFGQGTWNGILSSVLDAGGAVAGHSIAKGLGGNEEWQIFGQFMGPAVLGSRGLGGMVVSQMGNAQGGYQQAGYQEEDYPRYETHAPTRGVESPDSGKQAELITDQNGKKYLCYDDGCKPVRE